MFLGDSKMSTVFFMFTLLIDVLVSSSFAETSISRDYFNFIKMNDGQTVLSSLQRIGRGASGEVFEIYDSMYDAPMSIEEFGIAFKISHHSEYEVRYLLKQHIHTCIHIYPHTHIHS